MERSQHTQPRTIGSRRREEHYFSSDTLRISKASPLLFFYTFCFLCLFSFLFNPLLDSLCLARAKKETFFFFSILRFCRKEKFLRYFAPFHLFNFLFPFVREKKSSPCHCVQSTVNFLTTNLSPSCVLGPWRRRKRRKGRERKENITTHGILYGGKSSLFIYCIYLFTCFASWLVACCERFHAQTSAAKPPTLITNSRWGLNGAFFDPCVLTHDVDVDFSTHAGRGNNLASPPQCEYQLSFGTFSKHAIRFECGIGCFFFFFFILSHSSNSLNSCPVRGSTRPALLCSTLHSCFIPIT